MWVGAIGSVFFLMLAGQAVRDSHTLWRGATPKPAARWSFWKGVVGNLANPLTWTFWLITGTPTMIRARDIGGWTGVAVFTITWFVVASGIEAAIAFVVATSGRHVGSHGQAIFTGLFAIMFTALAVVLITRDVLPGVFT